MGRRYYTTKTISVDELQVGDYFAGVIEHQDGTRSEFNPLYVTKITDKWITATNYVNKERYLLRSKLSELKLWLPVPPQA